MEQDVIIRGLLFDGCIKVMAISAMDMVKEARKAHGLSRLATAALGRSLMMTSMMGAQLKDAGDRVTTMLKGGGELGNVICTARQGGIVKGYLDNPECELPPAPNGKLDVALGVGWFGELVVVKDLGLKEPYVGRCEIVSGEIAEDFANYFTKSEQQPSLVYLGVRMEAYSGDVLSAGGLLVQALPNCPDEFAEAIEKRATEIERISVRLQGREVLETILNELFSDMGFELLEKEYPAFKCDCSKERLERVLISLGREELLSMADADGGAEISCHFCNTQYWFTDDELRRLAKECI